jgi:ADP-heptose:LPS heptosyltransferase
MKFDYVILATSGFAARSLKLAKMLAPEHIIGFVTEQANSSKIDLSIPHAGGENLHETEDMFRLLAPLGISGSIPELTVVADVVTACSLRQQLPVTVDQGTGPLVALHISARKEKQRWPVENFSELAHRLHLQHDASFLVFWSPGDENNPFHPGDDGKAVRLLAALADLPAAPMRTEHLSELIAGLSLCDAAVLSDGGGMHVAAGLGKPLVCFFGNSSADRWHPWGVSYELLQKPSRDVSEISVDEAAAAFARLMI